MSRKRIRLLALTLYPDRAASPRYRITQFVPFLEEHGVECTVAPALSERRYAALTGPGNRRRPFWYHGAETPRRVKQILAAGGYDVVFLQKSVMTAYLRGMAGLLRRFARRLIYDFDDAVHLAPPHPLRGPWHLLEDPRQTDRLFLNADRVLAGNPWLAEVAQRAGAKPELFPTVIDTERFTPAPQNDGPFRVGWVGNPSTTVCIEPAVEALAGLRDADVTLIGADAERVEWPWARVEPWAFDTEVRDLQRLSVGIMPLPKQEWMRGKCALKALLYMACGVPCIASPFGAALDIIQHGENGFLADSTGEWREAIEQLRDPGLRRRIGMAGRRTVEQRFALRDAAPRLLDIIEAVT